MVAIVTPVAGAATLGAADGQTPDPLAKHLELSTLWRDGPCRKGAGIRDGTSVRLALAQNRDTPPVQPDRAASVGSAPGCDALTAVAHDRALTSLSQWPQQGAVEL